MIERSDQDFARALLDSARADEAPDARAAEAWVKFAATATAIGALPHADGTARVTTAAGTTTTGAFRASAARWLLLGALGGSAATAAWFGLRHQHPTVPVVAATPVGGSASRAERPPERPPAPAATASSPAKPVTRRIARPPTSRRLTDDAAPPAPESTLAAEVAALDAARAAAATGKVDVALDLIDRYHYDFPAGELAADAEVVAIEALSAKGDREEVARRANRFLARFPNDPHAAKVRRLAAR